MSHSSDRESSGLDVCVVGGCGRVGLPLALVFAAAGLRVGIFDINAEAVRRVNGGEMPFMEEGAPEILTAVAGSLLTASTDISMVSRARWVVVIIGTPVDEHLNPAFGSIRKVIRELIPYLSAGQCLILRSTIFPGTTERIGSLLEEECPEVLLAFCPERVAQGRAITELRALPQIVAGTTSAATAMAADLFGRIAHSIIEMSPAEAELVKIFANAWRYIQFATANQFFMIASQQGLDFYRLHEALTRDYPRMAGLPTAGFAAGPCLFKDTMQLAAAHDNNFLLGHAAMLVNEGLPNFVTQRLKERVPLADKTVGILGMAFKGESDDPRESLAFKLRKLFEHEAARTLCSDEFISDPSFIAAEELIQRSDVVIIGAPHHAYRDLSFPDGKIVVDVWNLYGRGLGLV